MHQGFVNWAEKEYKKGEKKDIIKDMEIIKTDFETIKDEKKGGKFIDHRGIIELLYENAHVIRITSEKGSVRANHVHLKFGHFCIVLKGNVQYFEKKWKSNENIKINTYSIGETFETKAGYEHAMLFKEFEKNELICISYGARDQESYEKDLIRLDYDLTKK